MTGGTWDWGRVVLVRSGVNLQCTLSHHTRRNLLLGVCDCLIPCPAEGRAREQSCVCDCLVPCAVEGREPENNRVSVIASFPAQRRGEPENNHVSVIASFPAQRRGESQRTIVCL